MFKSSSPQTKSFVIIIAVIFIGTGISFWLLGKLGNDLGVSKQKKDVQTSETKSRTVNEAKAQEPEIDTSSWKEYKDNKYGMSFKYDPDWNIKPWKKSSEGFDVLEIDPGAKYYNIKIYANPYNFYVMDGLKAEETTVGGAKALNVSDMLYGVLAEKARFTFDVGVSLSLKPKFNALVKSVIFN